MIIQTIELPSSITSSKPLVIDPVTLTNAAFQRFGTVLSNPSPTTLPLSAPTATSAPLPCGGVSANQGTAIQYRAIAPPLENFYAAHAPSGISASARMSLFSCSARAYCDELSSSGSRRTEIRGHGNTPDESRSSDGNGKEHNAITIPIHIFERHPFTSQTFIPLSTSSPHPTQTPKHMIHYLVVVAPTLPDSQQPLVVAPTPPRSQLAVGPGFPDLANIHAFIANGNQAIMYAAGTWHAPMVALGPRDTSVDFVVVQYANGVPVEDCQEVVLGTSSEAGGGGVDMGERTASQPTETRGEGNEGKIVVRLRKPDRQLARSKL